jgi:hypothetical protein
MAPLTFNRETRLRVVSFTPRPLYPRGENPAPTYGGGRFGGPVRTVWGREKSLSWELNVVLRLGRTSGAA